MLIFFYPSIKSHKHLIYFDKNTIQYQGKLDYRQALLIVSGQILWKYVGVTHEYIEHVDKKIKISQRFI